MSRGSSKTPPNTTNPEARALINAALAKCEGCRAWWRLAAGTYRHRTPKYGWDCTAREERDKLREIAALVRIKQREKPYVCLAKEVPGAWAGDWLCVTATGTSAHRTRDSAYSCKDQHLKQQS